MAIGISLAHTDRKQLEWLQTLPELNDRSVHQRLRERYLSFRPYQGEGAIVDALCAAWNALRDETGRLTTLTGYPWITQAIDQVSK